MKSRKIVVRCWSIGYSHNTFGGKLVCDVCAGDAEVILRRISSVQRYKAVGSKEQQENQDRMLSGNADEDNYHPFLPFWQRPKSEAR